MTRPFRLTLEHVLTQPHRLTFRVAFDESELYLQLPYPQQLGLRFTKPSGELINHWMTGSLVSGEPWYEFVLRPNDRIAFDVFAAINTPPRSIFEAPGERWTIELPPGEARVEFVYEQKIDWAHYEAEARRSHPGAHAIPFAGRVVSNAVSVLIGSNP